MHEAAKKIDLPPPISPTLLTLDATVKSLMKLCDVNASLIIKNMTLQRSAEENTAIIIRSQAIYCKQLNITCTNVWTEAAAHSVNKACDYLQTSQRYLKQACTIKIVQQQMINYL
jgi:hypothetical protein